MNYTPMQELEHIWYCYQSQYKNNLQRAAMEFAEYFRANKDVLLYNEKHNIVDAYDIGNDPFSMHRNISVHEKTNGQIFFENNFINL
jgi:hypothetical protein